MLRYCGIARIDQRVVVGGGAKVRDRPSQPIDAQCGSGSGTTSFLSLSSILTYSSPLLITHSLLLTLRLI